MTVNLVLGFSNLVNAEGSDSKSKTYALLLSDIVQVGENNASLVTDAVKDFSEVSFFFKVGIQN